MLAVEPKFTIDTLLLEFLIDIYLQEVFSDSINCVHFDPLIEPFFINKFNQVYDKKK